MEAKSLKIKNESIFYSNDMIQLNNFDCQEKTEKIIIFIIFPIK